MNTQPFVVISLLNWNTPQRTLQCLHSLQALAYDHYRIVVIDNASQDDSVAQIRSAFPHIEVIVTDSNYGYAGGHEYALKFAQTHHAELLWLLNTDALVEPETLTHLVNAYTLYGEGLYGGAPLQIWADGKRLVDCPARYLKLGFVDKAFHQDEILDYDDTFGDGEIRRVSALCGSTLLVPLAVVQTHGWMNTRWFMYAEETDYCLRLGKVGLPIYFVPQSRILHEGGGSNRDWSGVRRVIGYYRARNEIVFAGLYGGLPAKWTIAGKKFLRGASLLPKDRLATRFIWRGVWDGLRNQLGKPHAPEDYLV